MRVSFVKFSSPLKFSIVLSGTICIFFLISFVFIFSFVREEHKQIVDSLSQSIVRTQRLQIQSRHFRGLTELLNQEFPDVYLVIRDLKDQTLFQFHTRNYFSTCRNVHNDILNLNMYVCKPFRAIVPACFALLISSLLIFMGLAFFAIQVEEQSKQWIFRFMKETGLKIKSTFSFRDILSEHKTRLQLVSHLAHDLRSPLLVFQESLRVQKAEDWERHKPRLTASMRRMQSMINSLNDSTLDEIYPIFLTQLNMNSVIEETQLYAKLRGIQFTVEIEPVSCFLDKEKMERAVSNLLHNAIKFAKSAVKFCVFSKDQFLIMHVIDDGPGVASEFNELIYKERFYFGSEGGTGLGLSYAQRIVAAHKGSLMHTCTDYKTVFEIKIPDCVKSK